MLSFGTYINVCSSPYELTLKKRCCWDSFFKVFKFWNCFVNRHV